MINEDRLKQYGREAILDMVILGVMSLAFMTILMTTLNYFGYEFRESFSLYPFIKETLWKLFMVFMGFSFGVIAIIEKFQRSYQKEIEG